MENQYYLDMYIPLLNPIDQHATSLLFAEIDIEKLLDFTTGLHVGEIGYVYAAKTKGQHLTYPDHSAVLRVKMNFTIWPYDMILDKKRTILAANRATLEQNVK